MTAQLKETYIEEGVDALTLLTPLIERRRRILFGVVLITLAVGGIAAVAPRKYKAAVSLTPVVNNRSSSSALGSPGLPRLGR